VDQLPSSCGVVGFSPNHHIHRKRLHDMTEICRIDDNADFHMTADRRTLPIAAGRDRRR